jgi:stage III sporulation protein AF
VFFLVAWLGGWLQPIIILVLVATFLHLLLPNPAMERYVKLVMGLLIILAILSPILQLFHHKLALAELAFPTRSPLAAKTMAPLDQIQASSQQLQHVQGQWVEKQTAYAMEQMVKQQVQQKFAVEVMAAKVVLAKTVDQALAIQQVQLTVRSKAETGSLQAQEMQPIRPVKPVQVEATVSQSAPPDSTGGAFHEVAQQIINDLAQTWHIKAEQIQLQLAANQ